jgi:hypothetical protein
MASGETSQCWHDETSALCYPVTFRASPDATRGCHMENVRRPLSTLRINLEWVAYELQRRIKNKGRVLKNIDVQYRMSLQRPI